MTLALISVIWKVPAPRVKMLHKTQLSYKKPQQVSCLCDFQGRLGDCDVEKAHKFFISKKSDS